MTQIFVKYILQLCIFRHLKLEIALAIPALNDEKYNSCTSISGSWHALRPGSQRVKNTSALDRTAFDNLRHISGLSMLNYVQIGGENCQPNKISPAKFICINYLSIPVGNSQAGYQWQPTKLTRHPKTADTDAKRRELSVVHINVCGLKSRMKCVDFYDFLNKHDIIIMTETIN